MLLASLLLSSGPAAAIDAGLSGLWYNPAQSGHGFEVNVLDSSSAAVSWYTYDANGFPIWTNGVLSETSPGVLSGTLYYYQGMRFGTFSPATNQRYTWGTVAVTFNGCNAANVVYNGTLTYTDGTGFGQGSVPIERLAPIAGLECGATTTPAGSIAGVYKGVISTPDGPLDLYAVAETNGSFTAIAADSAVYTGTYSVASGRASLSLVAYAPPGMVFANGQSSIAGSASGPVRPGESFSGTYTGGGFAGQYGFKYEPISQRRPSLATLAGAYQGPGGFSGSLTSTGVLSGSDSDGCRYNGTVVPSSSGLSYNMTVALSGCLSGTFSGKAIPFDIVPGDSRGLAVTIRIGNNATATLFQRR